MTLSARNRLRGRIVGIDRGPVSTKVKIDIGGSTLTSTITTEAADELRLQQGDEVGAIIKSSDVMIEK